MNLMYAKSSLRSSTRQYSRPILLAASLFLWMSSHAAESNVAAPSSGPGAMVQLPSDPYTVEVKKGEYLRGVPAGPGKYAYVNCDDHSQAISTVKLLTNEGIEAQCADLSIAGVAPTVVGPKTHYSWLPDGHQGSVQAAYLGPPNTLDVFAGHNWSNGNVLRQAAFAGMTFNGNRLIIKPDTVWTKSADGCEGRVVAGYRKPHYVLCADVIATDQPRPEAASLILTHWKTKMSCTFPIPTGTVGERRYLPLEHRLNPENPDAPYDPCVENTTESIELERFPSAARILLTDDGGCSKGDEELSFGKKFWIELRTTAKSVTIDAIPLDEILTYQPGSIIRPGLMLVGSHLKSGEVATRNLSCIMVTTSSAPPAK